MKVNTNSGRERKLHVLTIDPVAARRGENSRSKPESEQDDDEIDEGLDRHMHRGRFSAKRRPERRRHIYLPTSEAGKVRIGSDARITLDAVPDVSIPAKVGFIATQAQFTPKTVETKDERDKLMFRIRVKIDPERLRAR